MSRRAIYMASSLKKEALVLFMLLQIALRR